MSEQLDADVVVVGAGLGGIYALHKFREMGLKVIGLEKAAGVGGVWRHNRYPGSRVDLESVVYCYHFWPELYRTWQWSERYAAQPELLRYLEHVADALDVKPLIRFNTPMRSAEWRPDEACYRIQPGDEPMLKARFLVMATGNLSHPRDIPFKGAERFRGELLRSSRWPDREIAFAGKRVALVGTGSSGVQIATALAGQAEHLHVFQRSPNYSVPARNGAPNAEKFEQVATDCLAERDVHFYQPPGKRLTTIEPIAGADCTEEEFLRRLDAQWDYGGQGMGYVFTDQTTDREVNERVSAYVRDKIRATVGDPAIADKLIPDYPFGTRRLIIDTGYYEIFGRDDVTLVDCREEPIEEITETGIRTASGHYAFDVIILALGFKAFRGEIDNAGIRNEQGQAYTARWDRGPRTLLGLMTAGFPNLFTLTGAGSPAVLSNLFLCNEYHVEWLVRLFDYMADHGLRTIEPTLEGEDAWTRHNAEVASGLIRLEVDNYMVHVNIDGSRVFMPYTGGFNRYIEAAEKIAANDYEGFAFTKSPSTQSHQNSQRITTPTLRAKANL